MLVYYKEISNNEEQFQIKNELEIITELLDNIKLEDII